MWKTGKEEEGKKMEETRSKGIKKRLGNERNGKKGPVKCSLKRYLP